MTINVKADVQEEVLQMPGCFTVGERLAEIALRRDSGQALASIVSDVGDINDARDMMPNLPPSKRLQSLDELRHDDSG